MQQNNANQRSKTNEASPVTKQKERCRLFHMTAGNHDDSWIYPFLNRMPSCPSQTAGLQEDKCITWLRHCKQCCFCKLSVKTPGWLANSCSTSLTSCAALGSLSCALSKALFNFVQMRSLREPHGMLDAASWARTRFEDTFHPVYRVSGYQLERFIVYLVDLQLVRLSNRFWCVPMYDSIS